MAGEIELYKKRPSRGVMGFDKDGLAGGQIVNRHRNIVAIYGDSTAEQSHSDANFLIRAAWNSISVGNTLAGCRIVLAANHAKSGERSDQMLVRFRADVDAAKLDPTHWFNRVGTVIIRIFTNDPAQAPYTDVITGVTIAMAGVADAAIARVAEIVDTCTANGKQVNLATVWGSSNMTAAGIGQLARYNALIQSLASQANANADRPSVFLTENRTVRNSLTTTLAAVTFGANLMRNESGIFTHEQLQGAFQNAKIFAEDVKRMMPPLPRAYIDGSEQYSANQRQNILLNPNFLIGAGGTAGVLGTGGTLGTDPTGAALSAVPDNWTVVRLSGDTTTTFTVNVKEDAIGRYLQIVETTTSAGGGVRVQQSAGTVTWNVGEYVQGFSTIEIVAGAVNLAAAYPYVEINGTIASVNATIGTGGLYNDTTHGVFATTDAYVLEDATERALIPTYDTKGYVLLRAVSTQHVGAGSATINVRRPRLAIVPDAPVNNLYAGS